MEQVSPVLHVIAYLAVQNEVRCMLCGHTNPILEGRWVLSPFFIVSNAITSSSNDLNDD